MWNAPCRRSVQVAGVRRDTVIIRLPPSRDSKASSCAIRPSNQAASSASSRCGPPISTAVRGCGNCCKVEKSTAAAASQASSTGFSAPMVRITLPASMPSWRGAITRSNSAGSTRGSRIWIVKMAPPLLARSARVSRAACRPQPIANCGHGGASSRRSRVGRARLMPATRRGANQRHGAGHATRCVVATRPIAPASAST